MLLLSSISNKDVLFIFSANKVAAEEAPLWVPLEQKVVKDVHRLNSQLAFKLGLVRLAFQANFHQKSYGSEDLRYIHFYL